LTHTKKNVAANNCKSDAKRKPTASVSF